jgi:eukaryotic-like serine/threonine-protein kinase
MRQLSDSLVARLQAEMQEPELTGTRYRLVRFVARGGMGSVWLVEDTMLHRRVALKVLDFVAPGDDLAARLLQEAQVLAGLEHPGIVPVHDGGILSDGRAFYCMKYVEGETLAQHVAGKSLGEKLRLLRRIAEPLDFAHTRGIIHRDLKPENIMIGAFGEVLIMDWGLARVGAAGWKSAELLGSHEREPAASRITGRGGVLGTPGYAPPEQLRGDTAVDRRADVFSLGAVLWFMLTGSSPGMSGGDGRVPRALRAICEKAMAADVNARYQSVGEMDADLARYQEGAPVNAYPESLLERANRIYTRHSTAIVLVAAYLLMRLLFILLQRR